MKFFRVADAFYERRREGPPRFTQNRPGISVVALKKYSAAEKSKDQFYAKLSGSLDFRLLQQSQCELDHRPVVEWHTIFVFLNPTTLRGGPRWLKILRAQTMTG